MTFWSTTTVKARLLRPGICWQRLGQPEAVCLTPSYVESVLRQAGFKIGRTETMLPGITMLITASKP